MKTDNSKQSLSNQSEFKQIVALYKGLRWCEPPSDELLEKLLERIMQGNRAKLNCCYYV